MVSAEKELELSLKFVSVGHILPSVLWLVHSHSQKKLGRQRNTNAGKTLSYLQLLNGGLEITIGINAVMHSHSHKQSYGGQSYFSWQFRADFLILPVQEPCTVCSSNHSLSQAERIISLVLNYLFLF